MLFSSFDHSVNICSVRGSAVRDELQQIFSAFGHNTKEYYLTTCNIPIHMFSGILK